MIKTQLHTVFMTIGASHTGKTTFIKNIINTIKSKYIQSTVQYISTQEIRDSLTSNENDYNEISFLVEQMLLEKLKIYMSYPLNTHFIFIDFTGLKKEIREKILQLTQEYHYHTEVLLFENQITEHINKKNYYSQMKSINQEIKPVLKHEKYHQIHLIKNINQQNFECTDYDQYQEHLLNDDYDYYVIGDVHECVDTLKSIVENSNDKTKFILAGDWVDKGLKTEETINYLYKNQDKFLLVIGNHEYKNYHKLLHQNDKINENDFTAYSFLIKNVNLKHKFLELYSKSKTFYKYIGNKYKHFIVTHVCTENKF